MIINNSKLVPKGFIGITIWPFIFLRYDAEYHGMIRYTKLVIHEKIHLIQEAVLIVVSLLILIPIIWYFNLTLWLLLLSYSSYYILYGIFYLIYGYKNIPFEKEAKENEKYAYYLKHRKLFAWIKYFKK